MNFPGTFHHVGVACRSIQDETASIAPLGYVAEGSATEDPIQKVRVQFFSGVSPRIELIEPTSQESPVFGLLKRGTKFYHLAYVVDDFDGAVGAAESNGFRAVGPAAPAVAFGMRRIIFMMAKSGMLIELIEAASRGGP